MAHPFPSMNVQDDPAEFLISAAARDALIGRKIWRQIATYHEVVPPMHKGNPYIEALASTPSREDLMKMLEVRLPYSGENRLASVEDRAQMVMQLLNFVQPLTKTLEVFDLVNRAMRSSYVTRNPASPRFLADARKAALELQENWSQNPVAWRKGVAAFAVAVLGATGVGKTTAVGAGLALFPSCIIHITYRGLPIGKMQIPWLKLDCPQDGSLKALFIAFFIEVDIICAGKTNYARMFGGHTTDVMIYDIGFICGAHGIGVLAVDQVNNLRLAASQQDEKLFQALLALVNGIGVSVFFIGTFAVERVLRKQFQIARRCCALGSITIKPLTYDEKDTLKELKESDLGLLIRGMWRYCYVRDPCKLDKSIFSALYRNSRGISALIVGLYILAHLRCFRIKKEQITAEIIDQVAGDRLRLLRPLLDLLGSGQVTEADVPGLDDLISPGLQGAIEAEMSHGRQHQASAAPDELVEAADSGADSRPLGAQRQESSIDAPVGEASSISASTKERRPMKQARRSLVTISRNAAKNKLSVHDALQRAGFIRDITTPALAS
jgi:hypothetical protein